MTEVTKGILPAAAMLALALLAAPVLMAPMGAEAQTPPTQQPPQQLPDAPDQEELVRFAEAVLDVQEIQQEMQQVLAGVDSPEQASQVQQQANAEMEEALEEHDLTVERYSEIATVLDFDPELSAQFQEVLNQVLEAREGPSALN